MLDQRGTGHSNRPWRVRRFAGWQTGSSERVSSSRRSGRSPERRRLVLRTTERKRDRSFGVHDRISPQMQRTCERHSESTDGTSTWSAAPRDRVRADASVSRHHPLRLVTVPRFPQVDEITAAPGDLRGAVSRLFDTCAEDPACKRAFPNPAMAFREAAERLERDPVDSSRRKSSRPAEPDRGGRRRGRLRAGRPGDGLGHGPPGGHLGYPRAVYAALDGDVTPVARFLAQDPAGCVAYVYGCEGTDSAKAPITRSSAATRRRSSIRLDSKRWPETIRASSRRTAGVRCWTSARSGQSGGSTQRRTSRSSRRFRPSSCTAITTHTLHPLSSRTRGAGRPTVFTVRFPYSGHNLFALECPRSFRNVWVDEPRSHPTPAASATCLHRSSPCRYLGSHQASDWPRPPRRVSPLAPGPALHRRRDGLASSGGDVPQDARGRSTPSGLVDGTSRLATRRERSRLPGARGRRALAER